MDENVDLTMEALFARAENPALMLNTHFREHQRRSSPDSGIEAIDPGYVGRKIQSIISGMTLPTVREGFDQDHEWLERHSRIFGPHEAERIHRQIDPWSYMYDGSGCDCCGTSLNVLSRAFNFGICTSCNTRLEADFSQTSELERL